METTTETKPKRTRKPKLVTPSSDGRRCQRCHAGTGHNANAALPRGFAHNALPSEAPKNDGT